jgi:hypothetical protein
LNGYHDASVTELRRLVRERGLASGAAVVSARRENLIALLDGTITALPTSAPVTALSGDLAGMFAELARGAIDDALAAKGELRPIIHITLASGAEITLPESSHACLPRVLRLISAGLPVLLVGPSGSGKTHLSKQAAEALGLRFTFNSMSGCTSEASIFGRVLPDAAGNWNYKRSPFVATWTDGGIHLFDEVDAADPNLMVAINAPLANGKLSIPFADETPIPRHASTSIIFAANTFGLGADRQYVGRNALDAATLDRFSVSTVFVDYDTALERKLAAETCGSESAAALLEWAHQMRDSIGRNKLLRIMSTRTILNAARLLACGSDLSEVRESYFAGWTADERAKAGNSL